jgi:hypothetical protein
MVAPLVCSHCKEWQQDEHLGDQSAMYSNDRGGGFGGDCYKCGKPGHRAADCWSKGKGKGRGKGKGKGGGKGEGGDWGGQGGGGGRHRNPKWAKTDATQLGKRDIELANNQKISPLHQTTCPPVSPKDGRFDPTSPTSIDSS